MGYYLLSIISLIETVLFGHGQLINIFKFGYGNDKKFNLYFYSRQQAKAFFRFAKEEKFIDDEWRRRSFFGQSIFYANVDDVTNGQLFDASIRRRFVRWRSQRRSRPGPSLDRSQLRNIIR